MFLPFSLGLPMQVACLVVSCISSCVGTWKRTLCFQFLFKWHNSSLGPDNYDSVSALGQCWHLWTFTILHFCHPCPWLWFLRTFDCLVVPYILVSLLFHYPLAEKDNKWCFQWFLHASNYPPDAFRKSIESNKFKQCIPISSWISEALGHVLVLASYIVSWELLRCYPHHFFWKKHSFKKLFYVFKWHSTCISSWQLCYVLPLPLLNKSLCFYVPRNPNDSKFMRFPVFPLSPCDFLGSLFVCYTNIWHKVFS